MEVPHILIGYLLTAIIISSCITVAYGITGPVREQSAFSGYVDNEGVPIGPGHIDIARFYQDILKIQGNEEVIMTCQSSGNFSRCINDTYNSDPKLQEQYKEQMQQIRDAVDIGEQYGIQYRSVPFIRDLLK